MNPRKILKKRTSRSDDRLELFLPPSSEYRRRAARSSCKATVSRGRRSAHARNWHDDRRCKYGACSTKLQSNVVTQAGGHQTKKIQAGLVTGLKKNHEWSEIASLDCQAACCRLRKIRRPLAPNGSSVNTPEMIVVVSGTGVTLTLSIYALLPPAEFQSKSMVGVTVGSVGV